MKYFVGLDNGGTTTKAALFDSRGKEIGTASISTNQLTPRAGFVERDMEEMWRANCQVLREVLKKTKIDTQQIAGIGICGHGKGLYLWGKDGKAVRNGILSTDNRAYRYPAQWKADGTEQGVFERSCQHILACQPVALLSWLKDHEPENYANIQWVFECKDYIRFRLTGEAKAEITDYSGANFVNLHTREYDDELLKLFGLEEIKNALPPLCQSAEVVGMVSAEASAQCGLRKGTPVIGGMFDIDACALAVGVTDERNICMIAGTWSINEHLRREPVTDGSVLMNSLFCLPEYYLIEESSPTSAGNHAWFIRQLLPELEKAAKAENKSLYDEMNAWVESVNPEEFVPVFLPFIMGSNVHPNAKGAFLGISANHTRKHLLRSVYEGIAFSHRYHLEKLLATRTEKPECIRLAGGAARSSVWTQIFADVMKLPVETVAADETGALGCAIAAAAAVGEYESLADAAKHMSPVSGRVLPVSKNEVSYDRKYNLYKHALENLNSFWTDMQQMVEELGKN